MAKENEIEVFEYLRNRAKIEGININDFKQLLLATGSPNNKTYKNYAIKMAELNLLLLYDKDKNTNILIKCVKNYYNIKENDCYRIRTKLGTYNENQSKDACMKCHLNCMALVKNKTLSKL